MKDLFQKPKKGRASKVQKLNRIKVEAQSTAFPLKHHNSQTESITVGEKTLIVT